MNEHDDETKENEAEGETLDFTRPSYVFEPKEYHQWIQRGPYLVCQSCEIEHASFVGMEVLLIGLDSEGKPILKKRSEV